MKRLIKILVERIKNFFGKDHVLESTEEVHWVEHIYDTTFPGHKAGPGGWVNVHGFREGSDASGWTYFVGYDYRWMGIRNQDLVVRCVSKRIYDKYIGWGPENWLVHNRAKDDPELFTRDGDEVETEFVFRWGDDEKSFNVRFSGDIYGIEK